MLLAFRHSTVWWARRYEHITTIVPDGESWISLDLDRTGLHVRSFFIQREFDDYLHNLVDDHDLVFVEGKGTGSYFFNCMTCVSLAKHATGVRSRALLPDTFMRDILKHHGVKVLHGRSQDPGNERTGATAPACSGGTDTVDPEGCVGPYKG